MDILILEDNPADAETLRVLLQREFKGVTIAVFHSESEFIKNFPSIEASPPAVAILDVYVPWGSALPKSRSRSISGAGPRCAERLRRGKQTADVAIAFYTSAMSAAKGLRKAELIEKGESKRLLRYVDAVLRATERFEGKSLFRPDGPKIFVIHGHDENALNNVVRTLYEVGTQPVVLRDTVPDGLTSILQHLEENADVEYAVAVVTPDDVGALARGKDQKARARQNVILETGYFLARLGRTKVALLVKGRVERPSDLDGTIWIWMDRHGVWKSRLAAQMAKVGLNVDRSMH